MAPSTEARAPARPHLWPELAALLATAVIVALDSGDAHLRGLRALFDWRASNINDPWPTTIAAARLAAGVPLYDDFTPVGSAFIYPPLAAAPYAPLAGAPFDTAWRVLSIASRVAWVLALAIAGRLAWDRARPRATAAFVATAALGFYPLLRAVELNQATLLVVVLFGAALLAAARERLVLAGITLAAAAALKPQLALVVPLLAWGPRRLILSCAAALGVLGLLSFAYGGLHNHVEYVTRVLPALSGGYAFYPNQSWSALLLRLAGAPPFDFALPPVPPAVRIGSLLATITSLALGAWLSRRAVLCSGARGADLPLLICLAWLVVTLASPISWEHHFAPAIFAFAHLFGRRDRLPPLSRGLACAAFPLVAGYFEVAGFHGIVGRIAMSYVTLGACLLLAALATSVGPQPSAGASAAGRLVVRVNPRC